MNDMSSDDNLSNEYVNHSIPVRRGDFDGRGDFDDLIKR